VSNSSRHAQAVAQLATLMENLRDPVHGCAWDRKQTISSLARHTLEEVYEVLDAIEKGDPEKICDELGDLLFQVVFYARIAEEQGLFDLSRVSGAILGKLLHRHPHIFPDGTLESFGQPSALTAEQVERNWEHIKNAERQAQNNGKHVSVLDDIPSAMPALDRASKLQKRAASVGFDWTDTNEVLARLEDEIRELREAMRSGDATAQHGEMGDVLFSCVNLSRHLKVDPRSANRRFEQRFRYVEQAAARSGGEMQDYSSEILEQWWQAAKQYTQ
jgi:nucleoside triphosphate diphosphatase